MNVINWTIAHWADIGSAAFFLVAGARIIVKLTPTPKDDTALEKVVEFLKHVGLVVKDKVPLLLAACLLSSCVGTLPDGTKTYGMLTGEQWKTIAVGVFKREVLPVAAEVKAAKAANAEVTVGKNPVINQ